MVKRCPLYGVHEKFDQAFILWEQCNENYFNPKKFITNINALIQALRNITFTIENEKHNIPDFDVWYKCWTNKLKDDQFTKWISDSRTSIVHKKDFELSSRAIVSCYDYSTIFIANIDVPIFLSTEEIVKFLKNKKMIVKNMENAEVLLDIRRVWTHKDFPNYDVLYILLCSFIVYSNMIADLHKQMNLNAKNCNYYIEENKTGFPNHLINLIQDYENEKTSTITLKDLSQINIKIEERILTKIMEKIVKERYKVPLKEIKGQKSFFDQVNEIAKIILQKDHYIVPMVFLIDNNGKTRQLALEQIDRSDKYLIMHIVAKIIKEENIKEVLFVNDSYIFPIKHKKKFEQNLDISKIKDKKDCLSTYHITADRIESYYTIYKKLPNQEIEMQPSVFEENLTNCNFLIPIIKALKEVNNGN